jgi:hypothetical protein
MFFAEMTAKPVDATQQSKSSRSTYPYAFRLGRTVEKRISPFFTARFALLGALLPLILLEKSILPVPFSTDEISI